MSNEQDLIQASTIVSEPVKKALSRQPFSRNRFLKIFSRNPVEYHPIFGAYDVAPEMPLDQIATAAQQKGDKVLVLEGAAAVKEGWAEKNETLQRRGNGLVLMRKPGQVVASSAGQPFGVNDFIEGIGVYPLEETASLPTSSPQPAESTVLQAPQQPQTQGSEDFDAMRAISPFFQKEAA